MCIIVPILVAVFVDKDRDGDRDKDGMMQINIIVAWTGMLLGCFAGAVQGLLFAREKWLGGYASWERRLMRLGHVSFFGIAFINLGFAFTVSELGLTKGMPVASRLLVVGALGMPLLCYLSAFRQVFRHLFFIPVLSIVAAIAITLRTILLS